MNRRDFLKVGGLATGLVAVPTVALADHVTEPTIAIKGLDLQVYDYPDRTTMIVNPDGSEVRDWTKARIEGRLSFEKPNGLNSDNANPSEHFDVVLRVDQVHQTFRADGTLKAETIKKDWGANWQHQNRPAHSNTSQQWDVANGLEGTNSYLLQDHLGIWQVFCRVKGLESLRVLEKTVRFRIVAP